MRALITGIVAAALLGYLTAGHAAIDRERLARLTVSLVKVEATDRQNHVALGSGVPAGWRQLVAADFCYASARHSFRRSVARIGKGPGFCPQKRVR